MALARTAILAGVVVLCSSVFAAQPQISVHPPACVPVTGNVPVAATLSPAYGWASVRVYFRKAGEKAFYYLEARVGGDGRYWVTLPKPETQTTVVEYYVAVRDAEGIVTPTAPLALAVSASCQASLSAEETRFAHNLVVGETSPDQRDKEVLGFLCDGVVSRINVRGDLLPDEQCRRVLASRERRAIWLPIAAAGAAGSGVIIIRRGEESKARP